MIYHYTNGRSARKILHSGHIKPFLEKAVDTNSNLVEWAKVPFSWWTTNDYFERAMQKVVSYTHGDAPLPKDEWDSLIKYATREETALFGFGLVRFGVADDCKDMLPYPMATLKAGMPKELVIRIAREGFLHGANWENWYGSLEPVFYDQWKSIEYLKIGYWNEEGAYLAEGRWEHFPGFVPSERRAETMKDMEEFRRGYRALRELDKTMPWRHLVSSRIDPAEDPNLYVENYLTN